MHVWSGRRLSAALVAACALLVATPARAKTEIHLWHGLTGQLGEAVVTLANRFNQSQAEFEVKPLNKGSYAEVLTAAIAAYRAKQPPHVVQVFEVGTQTMLLSGAVVPVYQLVEEQGVRVDWNAFVKPIVAYYSKDGRLYSMPFNSSTPIFYYNKDAFKQAGLDPSKPPETWQQVEQYARKILSAGAARCGFSAAWPSWTMVENMHAWHDQPFATNQNGFGGLDTKLLINGELGVKHVGQLAAWQKENVFSYGGRMGTADPKFVNGECAMYIQSSALIGSFSKNLKFAWGTGQLPHWGPPFPKGTSIIGGATLWVMKGLPAADYKGVAKFLEFVSSVEQQKWWHKQTGYLAVSTPALRELRAEGHFKEKPEQWVAFAQLTGGNNTPNTQGIRLGNFVQVRNVIEEELENVFAGKKTAKQGLDEAVARGNVILKEFAELNR
jgi:sn-glycerol 3-phosphate transport system substrate-binding protein